jgi:DNA-binding NarL/FixJ family response regulator
MSTDTIKIIIADDHTIMRDGLRSLLEKQLDIKPIAEADNGRKTLKLVQELKPDVVIMDISMPDLNGIEATRQIKKETPGVKVIALSMHSDKHFVTEMLKAGASGYLLKHCAFEELSNAIQAVVNNRSYLSPEITGIVLKDLFHNNDKGSKVDKKVNNPLTGREREILQLLAEGKTIKETASDLNLSIKTIETHKQHIMDKINLHTIAELTKYAIIEGLTTLEKTP